MNQTDPQLINLLQQITVQLSNISNHLGTLAQAARHEHPEAFKAKVPVPGAR